MTTDDRFRALYARALASAAPDANGPHAEPDELLSLVRRDGPEERRLELLDHVMSCESCRHGFELLRSIEVAGAAAAAAEAPVVLKQRRPLRTIVPFALAASVTLVLGVAIVERFGLLQRTEITRAADEAVILLAPGAEVTAGQPLFFAWRPVESALRYELEILDASDAVTFSATTSDTVLSAASVNLAPRTEYRWWVRAVTPGGDVTSAARSLQTVR